MIAKEIKEVVLTFLSLVLGLVGIWFGADEAYDEGEMTDMYIWVAMGIFWAILITAALIHVIINPKDMIKRNEEDNPFYRYDHFLNRLGYFILRGIGFTIMFYYIGWLISVEHDYLWVDILGGVLLSCWLAVFNYINYNKEDK